MIKIAYNTRTYVKPTGLVMIRIRWDHKEKQCSISTGVKADIEKWDKELQKARRNTTHTISGESVPARVINEAIDETMSYIAEFFQTQELKGKIPSPDSLKNAVNLKLGKIGVPEKKKADEYSLKEVFDDFIEKAAIENSWGPKSHCKYNQMYNLLISYHPKANMSSFDRDFLVGWKEFLVKKGYHNHTINKHYRNLKCFLRWAQQNGHTVRNDIFAFKTKLSAPLKTVIYLTMEEVEEFAKYEFPDSQQYLARARDYFIFMCCTSLRYSDMKALKIASVANGFIDVYTIKTRDKIRVPLNLQAQEIFERYSKDNPGEYLFNAPSNQKLNDYLKIAAKEAGLDREVVTTYFVGTVRHEETHPLYDIISCHCGRRTFVCIALALGMPPSVVMSITGHSDYQNMLPYISIGDSTAQNEMRKWDVAYNKDTENSEAKKAIINAIEDLTPDQLKKLLSQLKDIEQ